MENSSWEPVSDWYNQIVGDKGHEQHQIIIPKILKLMNLQDQKNAPLSLLDIGCGQGVIVHYLPPHVSYVGIDLSPSLLSFAQRKKKRKNHAFLQADATRNDLQLSQKFTHALALLSLQNMNNMQMVFQNVAKHLIPGGKFGFVINHPAFRIPKNSNWCLDPHQRRIFRRLDYYLSSLKIAIQSNPSQGESSSCTWSYHAPLSDYFKWAHEMNMQLLAFEEWTNENKAERDKQMARVTKEFPLFAAFVFQKN